MLWVVRMWRTICRKLNDQDGCNEYPKTIANSSMRFSLNLDPGLVEDLQGQMHPRHLELLDELRPDAWNRNVPRTLPLASNPFCWKEKSPAW